MSEPNEPEGYYLSQSALLFKIYGGLFLFGSLVLKPLQDQYGEIIDPLALVAIIPTIFLAPLGLYYSLKSEYLQESGSEKRFMYLISHILFCMMMVFFMYILLTYDFPKPMF